MNEAQLKTFVRHAFQMSDAGLKAAKKANPVLADVMQQVRRMVEALPNPEHITRELVWKSMQPQVKRLMTQYNDALGRELAQSLVDMQPGDVMAAGRQMEHIGIEPSPESLHQLPISGGELKVNDVKLQKWFSSGNNELSLWAKSNFDSINKAVQRGIFEALPTNDIAWGIIEEANLGKKGVTRIAGNTQAGKIYRQAQTLARTAIAEQNHQINGQIWDANKEAMDAAGVEYEWVAALDSKTCPTCAPLDGQIYKSRKDAPQWPIHPNCRCSVVPSRDSDELRQQTGQEISKEPFKYKGKTLKEISGGKRYQDMSPKEKAEWDEALSKGGLYASKVKVNGEWYYRKTKTSQGKNYADYIGKANKETQVEFFGSERRAEVFRQQVADGRDPREAMVAMLRGSNDDKTWRPSKKQAEKGVSWKKIDQVKATWKPSAKKVPVAAKSKPKATIAKQTAELQQVIDKAKKSAAPKPTAAPPAALATTAQPPKSQAKAKGERKARKPKEEKPFVFSEDEKQRLKAKYWAAVERSKQAVTADEIRKADAAMLRADKAYNNYLLNDAWNRFEELDRLRGLPEEEVKRRAAARMGRKAAGDKAAKKAGDRAYKKARQWEEEFNRQFPADADDPAPDRPRLNTKTAGGRTERDFRRLIDMGDAPASKVKAAWLRAMKANHPDAGGSEAAAKRINQEYQRWKQSR